MADVAESHPVLRDGIETSPSRSVSAVVQPMPNGAVRDMWRGTVAHPAPVLPGCSWHAPLDSTIRHRLPPTML